MKAYRTFLITITVFIVSCNTNKKYKYIEVVSQDNLLGGTEVKEKDAKQILASNDSAAYLDAYETFCISKKVNMDMEEALGTKSSTPLRFKLFNSEGEDITSIVHFLDKDKREKEIEKQIFSLENSFKQSLDKSTKQNVSAIQSSVKIDSVTVKGLLKYFIQKKDEFSPNNLTWIKPKSAPQYTNRNGIYCYFQTQNGVPDNLRFRVQYYSDDWLFFKKIQFSIDGKAYEYIPSNTDTDNGDGGYIWEWFDEPLVSSDRDLIYALAKARTAKMKFVGRQYYDIKPITQEQMSSIKRTLELYQAMGGQF